MKIGYTRVSTGLQNLDLQEDSLNKFGCEKIFTDHMSGARGRFGGRPEKLTKQDLDLLKTLLDSGTPIKTIAERWNVSRTTIYRYLDKMGKKIERQLLTSFSV
ncbi:recombinase family protein [Enterococcus mundtii]|uniref:recombinase family protein n=1 Tax=Enterococcus mundtii TaxID=53346 RepID=UPI001377DEAF|nr:recombinase family protein [Enterococcus mundtii]NBA63609.1 helix-turn-helix domain-containing protein [Enterococcus mundtii]